MCRWGSIEADGVPDYAPACQQPSTEVDHIGASDNHDPMFLRGICSTHHAMRTGRQGAAARNALPSLKKRPAEPHPGYIQDVP